jgi:hypothetical protein
MNSQLVRRINKLEEEGYTGTVTLAFHKGSVSKKIKLEVIENTHAFEPSSRQPANKKIKTA